MNKVCLNIYKYLFDVFFTLVVSLKFVGVNPEALAQVVKEVKRESSSIVVQVF